MRRPPVPRRVLAALALLVLAAAGVTTSGATFTAGTSHTETFSSGDWTAPVITLTAPADGAWVATATPALSGVAGILTGDAATVSVDLYAGTSAGGTPDRVLVAARDGSTGAWSVTPTALPDGPWTAVARQDDAGGNTGSSTPATFRVDTAAPAPAITAPAAGARVNGTPTISGTAGDAPGDAGTLTVRLYAGAAATGTPVRTLTATRTGTSWSIAVSPGLPSGTYTATAAQADLAGNAGTSAPRTFTVDATAPTGLRITAPASGATLTTPNPVISGRAGTATGDSATVTVNLYAGATPTGTPVRTLTATRAGRNWSLSVTPGLPDGQYTAQATQADDVGNLATSAARSFRIDTAAPVLAIAVPATGARVGAAPVISGTAGIATGDSATVTVRVYAGPAASGSPVRTQTATRNATTGAWSLTLTPALADGTYTAQAAQSDAGGNAGLSAARTFTADGTPPAGLAISAPVAGATVGPAPLVSGAAGDATGDSATVTVRLYAGASATGTPVRTLTATRTGQPWATAPVSPVLASGTYTATATQADDAGNSATSAPITFTVDATPPAGLTITAPAANAVVATALPTFSGAAGNAAGDQATVTLDVYAGASATGTPVRQFPTTRTAAAWTLTPAPGGALPDGQYTARLRQSDAVGNVGTSAPVSFRVDTTAPVVTIAAPADGARTVARPPISGGAGILLGDQATVTVEIWAGTTPAGAPVQTLSATRSATTGAWSVTPATLPDGTYAIRARQADSAGNTGTSAVVVVTADGTPPVAQAIAAANAGTPGTLAGRLDAGDRLTLSYSEALRPSSILAGWDGTATAMRARFFAGGASDRLALLNDGLTAALGLATGGPGSGGINLRGDYVSGQVTFAATMTLSPDGRTVTVVLGAPDAPGSIRAAAVAPRDMRWSVSTAARDLAGNAVTGATVTESDGDRDF
ncbi:MAG: Ig-like domain-containing protein [Solirubrobacteraceae bacterium]|nr:Ig-like domain-containing protein [Solirubrobacteraceae bacterium]